jgi:hypothetical protein
MPPPSVTFAVEGDLDAAVARRLLMDAGFSPGPVYGRRGKDHLDLSINGFNRAALRADWLVLRDLDTDAACAPQLVSRLLPERSAHMCFRVVVRTIEAWLLADREVFARWLRLSLDVIPPMPESLADPKARLVQLARRSRHRLLREALVPADGTSPKVGPGYTAKMTEFATDLWRPRAAAANAPSLGRCIGALERLRSDV